MKSQTTLVFLALPLIWLVACGGTQVPDVDTAEVAAAVPAPVVPDPIPEPPPVVEDQVYYQIYWEDIHVLTAYPGEGSLRSEESGSPDAGLTGTCEYMSAISHYLERETIMMGYINRATTFDEFLEVLAGEEGYEWREDQLEMGY